MPDSRQVIRQSSAIFGNLGIRQRRGAIRQSSAKFGNLRQSDSAIFGKCLEACQLPNAECMGITKLPNVFCPTPGSINIQPWPTRLVARFELGQVLSEMG